MLTVTMVHAAKDKMVSLPKTFNLSTGKESMCQTSFSDVAWGKATRSFAKSACALTKVKFDGIVQLAQEFMKPNRGRGKSSQAPEVIRIDSDDERGCLVDRSDSEGEQCKSLSLSVSVELKPLVRICVVSGL